MISPLYDIASSYLKDECNGNNVASTPLCEEALHDYIDHKINEFTCKQILQNCIGSSNTVDKITAILNVPMKPLTGNEPELESFHMQKRRKAAFWTPIEDQRLLYAMHIYGSDNWIAVAQFVGNHRTKAQCSQRWVRGLDPKVKKEPWTKEEEDELYRLVGIYGVKSWKIISQELKNRSDAQCRYRYNLLEKMKNNGRLMPNREPNPQTNYESSPSEKPETLSESSLPEEKKSYSYSESIFKGIDASILDEFLSLGFPQSI